MNYIHDTLEDKKKVEKDEIIICDNNIIAHSLGYTFFKLTLNEKMWKLFLHVKYKIDGIYISYCET